MASAIWNPVRDHSWSTWTRGGHCFFIQEEDYVGPKIFLTPHWRFLRADNAFGKKAFRKTVETSTDDRQSLTWCLHVLELPQAITQCRIYYPSQKAPELSPELKAQCLNPATQTRQTAGAAIEPRIVNLPAPASVSSSPHRPKSLQMDEAEANSTLSKTERLTAYDLSGEPVLAGAPSAEARPIVGTSVTEGDDSNWQWPTALQSPVFPLVFPQSTLPYAAGAGGAQLGQQSLAMCLQLSDLMDCVLARSCGPDLGG